MIGAACLMTLLFASTVSNASETSWSGRHLLAWPDPSGPSSARKELRCRDSGCRFGSQQDFSRSDTQRTGALEPMPHITRALRDAVDRFKRDGTAPANAVDVFSRLPEGDAIQECRGTAADGMPLVPCRLAAPSLLELDGAATHWAFLPPLRCSSSSCSEPTAPLVWRTRIPPRH